MDKKETALALHAEGSNCAQSVLCPFAEKLGFDRAQAHRLASALGGGVGRAQLLCGAVSGGAMALGAALGSENGSDAEAKEAAYAAGREFIRRIREEFGQTGCRELLGVDLLTEEGKAEVKARGLGESVCQRIIGRSVEIVEEMLAEKEA